MATTGGHPLPFLPRWKRRLGAAPDVLLRRSVEAWNRTVVRLRPAPPPEPDPELSEILALARTPTDISRHLPTLWRVALDPAPRLIVELGIRGGASTFVFERVARRCGATLLSVDIDDCSGASSWEGWHFVQEDDMTFVRRFPGWCADHGLDPAIDVLFLDTSHAYEHTRAELAAWMPWVAPGGRALVHDSNMGGLYRRGDWTVGLAADMQRGVARALHEFLGAQFDEREPFRGTLGGWAVEHDPLCCGLTVLRRLR